MRVALLVVVLFVFAPAVAEAGTYDVKLCADPAAPGFEASNSDPRTIVTTATCPHGGDPYSGVYLGAKVDAPAPAAGASASWTLSAPVGTTLQAVGVRYQYSKTDTTFDLSLATAEGDVLVPCPSGRACEATGTQTQNATRGLTVRLSCVTAGGCGLSPVNSHAWFAIQEATATVADSTPPFVRPPVAPAGWLRAADVAFAAEDNTGVATFALRAGDRTLATRDQTCDYRHLQPCPLKVSATAAADLADGVYALTTVATDPGGLVTTSEPATLKLDRTAPAAPDGLAIERRADGSFVYTWRNPDQRGMAPIVAAHLSDGTVVRGARLERLEATTGDSRLWLEDEAGNADPATATGLQTFTPIGVQRPILQTTAPKLRVTSAKRSGRQLVVKGTITVTAKVVATVARGKRSVRRSVTPKGGRFTITLPLTTALRRKGTNTLTVRVAGQTVSKRIVYR